MRKCAFLTTDNLVGYVTDDELAFDSFKDLGWEVEVISWRKPAVDWDVYDAVIIRTTWDYHKHEQAFLNVLEEIAGKSRLANQLPLIRWNLRKTYLSDLSDKDLPVVPTIFGDDLSRNRLSALFEELQAEEIVIKPVVSASAYDTFRVKHDFYEQELKKLNTLFSTRRFMAQPFLNRIVDEGEISIFYFNGEYSHGVIKTPRSGDFRVQEEHGGIIRPVNPEMELVGFGERVLHALQEQPLYARVDLVRDNEGKYVLMELELIEPALYFRYAPEAASRFALACDTWFRKGS